MSDGTDRGPPCRPSNRARGHGPETERPGSGVGRDGFGRVASSALAAAGRGDGEVGLMLPLAGPRLPGPALERDRADGRAILVADHLAPCPGISRTDLGGALADAKQTLTTRREARDGPPILGAGGFGYTHCSGLPRPTSIVPKKTRQEAEAGRTARTSMSKKDHGSDIKRIARKAGEPVDLP